MKILIIIVFVLYFCFASKSITFDFYSHLGKLKSCFDNNVDIESVLRDINIETNEIMIKCGNKSSLLGEYQQFLGNASTILSKNSKFIDTQSSEFIQFANNLVEIISKSNFAAMDEHLVDIMSIVAMTHSQESSDSGILNRFINLIPSLNFKMDKKPIDGAFSKLSISIKYFAAESIKRNYKRIILKYDKKDVIEDQKLFIEDFMAISNEFTSDLDSKYLIIIIRNLQKLEFESNSDDLKPVLNSLANIFKKQRGNMKISELVIDFIFSYKVAFVLQSAELCEDYFYLIYLSCNSFNYLGNKLKEIPDNIKEFLSGYLISIDLISRAYEYTAVLYQLNGELTENALNSVITATKQLRQLYKSDGLVANLIKLDYTDIALHIQKTLVNIFNDPSDELNFFTCKSGVYLSFIGFELFDGRIRDYESADLIGSVGRLMNASSINRRLDISAEVDEVLPIIDVLLENTLNTFDYRLEIIKNQEFPYYIKFIQLHPSEMARSVYTDIFLSKYISSNLSPDPVHFSSIESFEIGDKLGVYICAFQSIFEYYLKRPSDAKLAYLKEFYHFLKSEKLLSKTQMTLIENRTSLRSLNRRKFK